MNELEKQAMTNEASHALMKWLARWAKSAGVGPHVYIVGGSVRNFAMDQSLPIKDLDIVVDSVSLGHNSEWVAKSLMKAIPAKCTLTLNNYGVAILHVNEDFLIDGHNFKNETLEIASARTESYGGSGGKGYKPSDVQPANIKQDMLRREFNFNTLMWRLIDLSDGPDKAEIIDLTGCGLDDLKNRRMRCPGNDPDRTFSDDPSRLLRVIKFLTKYHLHPDADTLASIKRNAHKLKNIPAPAIATILVNLLDDPTAKQALQEMKKLGLLDVISEIAHSDPAFKATLIHWSHGQKLDLLFHMLDLGVPIDDRVKFLSADQQGHLRMIMPKLHNPEDFLATLKQPGKAADYPALIKEFNLKGPQINKLTVLSRDFLLAHPVLAEHGLTEALRRALQ